MRCGCSRCRVDEVQLLKLLNDCATRRGNDKLFDQPLGGGFTAVHTGHARDPDNECRSTRASGHISISPEAPGRTSLRRASRPRGGFLSTDCAMGSRLGTPLYEIPPSSRVPPLQTIFFRRSTGWLLPLEKTAIY
jgi:hypothetical protein